MTGNNSPYAIATLAGGCFWCLEAVYESVHGVNSVISGYMGGISPHPDYALVCTGTTGYAEVVQLYFDPAVIGYAQVLEIFFTIHDPTTLNRQGNDCGSQYRSAIFYHDAEQLVTSREAVARVQTALEKAVVTELVPAMPFYPAEPEHQHYFARHPDQAYCFRIIQPKVLKFRQYFPHWQRKN